MLHTLSRRFLSALVLAVAAAAALPSADAASRPEAGGVLTLGEGVTTRAPLRPPPARSRPSSPTKAAISLACGGYVVTLSTGSNTGTCTTDASGLAKCDDGDGNTARGDCQSCRKTTGAGSCLIH